MNDSQTIDSWDDLLASMETAVSHPIDTAWNIFRYMQKNYKEMGSHPACRIYEATGGKAVAHPFVYARYRGEGE